MEDVVRFVDLKDLHPFPEHPFSVKDDEKMHETVESILSVGVIVPGVVRPRDEGGYEIVSGHRRKELVRLPVSLRCR